MQEGRWSLKGMTALVTGGSRGIGLQLWRNLLDSGPGSIHVPETSKTSTRGCLNGRTKGFKSPPPSVT
ncbi:unnamed protein product [Linum trigynum]|uniref:Uncharacterized protein n=1 Tax=Linum trigynum TaxID=586398 RepID=A0AAV2E026_9ROSI